MRYLTTIFSRLWLLGLILFPFFAKAQFFIPIDGLSGLLRALQQSEPNTNRVNLLVKIGHIYVVKHGELVSDLDAVLLFNQQAYALSQSLPHPSGLSLSFLIATQAHQEKNQNPQRSRLLNMTLMQGFNQQLGSELNVSGEVERALIRPQVSDESLNTVSTYPDHCFSYN